MARSRKRTGYSQRSDGSWIFRRMIDKQRISASGSTLEECEQAAEKALEAFRKGIKTATGSVTLNKYFDAWNEQRRGQVKESTRYAADIRFKRVRPILGDMQLKKIEVRHIQNLQKELEKTELTTAGVNITLSTLSAVLSSAVKERLIPYNPCTAVKSLKRTEQAASETTHRCLTEQEQRLFLDAAKKYSWYYPYFAFQLVTGCRAGEAAAIEWRDIDRKAGVIHIRRTVSRISDKEYTTVKPKTRRSERDIPLTAAIDKLLTYVKQRQAILEDITSLESRIFQASDGDYIKPSSTGGCIRAILKRVKKDTGVTIPYFTCHAFRHTFVSEALRQGMPPHIIQALVGHETLSMTGYYTHVLDAQKAEAAQRIKIAI